MNIDGESLLFRATNVALQSGMLAVVVLGANEREHRKVIKDLPVDIILNEDWKNGMGSSLKKGLRHFLKQAPDAETIIVMVCDQPLLTSAHLIKLRNLYRDSEKSIIASYYCGTAGVPVLFNSSLFSEILNLPDEQGAKKIIQQHPDDTITIDLPDGEIDLDTPDDLRAFNER